MHVTGCVEGKYGEQCDIPCGHCAMPPCDTTTGACLCMSDENKPINATDQAACDPCLPGYNKPLCKGETYEDGRGWGPVIFCSAKVIVGMEWG